MKSKSVKKGSSNNPCGDSNEAQKSGVPGGSDDLQAQQLQKYLLDQMKTPEHLGITIRVTMKQSRYYVSEWRTDRQSYSGEPIEHPIARISPIRNKPGRWQLAWMRQDMKWHSLDAQYRGTFKRCAALIIEDPDCCFWG